MPSPDQQRQRRGRRPPERAQATYPTGESGHKAGELPPRRSHDEDRKRRQCEADPDSLRAPSRFGPLLDHSNPPIRQMRGQFCPLSPAAGYSLKRGHSLQPSAIRGSGGDLAGGDHPSQHRSGAARLLAGHGRDRGDLRIAGDDPLGHLVEVGPDYVRPHAVGVQRLARAAKECRPQPALSAPATSHECEPTRRRSVILTPSWSAAYSYASRAGL